MPDLQFFHFKSQCQWGQDDIDHATLCVKCDKQVFIDKDRGNIFVDPLMLRSKYNFFSLFDFSQVIVGNDIHL